MRVLVALLLSVAVAAGVGGARAAADAAPVRVALVTEPVGVVDSVWTQTVDGMRRAAAELDIDAEVVTPSARENVESVATGLARQGVDLVIGGVAMQAPAFVRAARANPRTQFVILDAGPGAASGAWPRNIQGVFFREQEVGYLVGYLAGLVERRRPGRDVVATIGGLQVPPVDHFIAGFQAGARRASPRIRTLNAYAGTFTDQERCARIGAAQIERGAGVVFPVAGACGNGALDVARRLGRWGIGVDADQSFLGPHILTSAVKRFDLAVYLTVARFVAGTLPTGGVTSLGLRQGALALGTVSPRVPRSLVARTLAVRREIAAGHVRIETTIE